MRFWYGYFAVPFWLVALARVVTIPQRLYETLRWGTWRELARFPITEINWFWYLYN